MKFKSVFPLSISILLLTSNVIAAPQTQDKFYPEIIVRTSRASKSADIKNLKRIAKKIGAIGLEISGARVKKISDSKKLVTKDLKKAKSSIKKLAATAALATLSEREVVQATRKARATVADNSLFSGSTFVFKFKRGTEISSRLNILKGSALVKSASQNKVPNVSKIPNDGLIDFNEDNVADLDAQHNVSNYWGFEKIGVPAARAKGFDGRGINIAVIDTGIDLENPDLKDSIMVNTGEIPDDYIDNDHNGYVDDYYGYNFAQEDKDRQEQSLDSDFSYIYSYPGHLATQAGMMYDYSYKEYHGTAVSGIIAAKENNRFGLAGVAPGAKILPLKALGYCWSNLGKDRKLWFSTEHVDNTSYYVDACGSETSVAQAIRYAISREVDVINLSISFEGKVSEIVEDAISEALAKGIIVVAGAGNQGANNDLINSTPETTNGVISVAASDVKDGILDKSNFGKRVSLAAPGVFIKTLYPVQMVNQNLSYDDPNVAHDEQYYASSSGTSFAAPMVTGSIALLLQKKKVNGAEILSQLQQYATSLDTQNQLGSGRVNVDKALGVTTGNESKFCTTPGKPLDVNNDGFVSPLDALFVINSINTGTRVEKICYDVNADGFLSPIDALLIINHLNTRGR